MLKQKGLKMNKTITFAQWSTQVSQLMVRECFRVMSKQGKEGELVRYVAKEFLYNFIGNLAMQTLEEGPPKKDPSKKEELDFVLGSFSSLKDQIQSSVGQAFGDAMSDFTGQDVEYYCQIKPIPEPTNRMPI